MPVTSYDSLLVAAGASQSYFGNDHFAEFAPGMKSIDDALELRGRIFGAFEMAELGAKRGDNVDHLLTFVVVGAGPTGVEMAGQIAELAHRTLKRDFRAINTRTARVEGGATWGDLNAATYPFGLATTGGIISTTGVGGLTLGGGIGYLSRGLGLSLDNLVSADVVTADGAFHLASEKDDPDLFWATVGGMGLTGVILRAQVQLKAIESSRCLVDTDRTPDLDSLMTLLAETDHLYEYSVAWIDTLAKGKRMGRSVVTRGRFARLDPYAGAQLALAESYRNVSTGGATPMAISDCLNFGSPEDPAVMWQFAEACRGLKDACLELGIPVTGGNVSLYNQTGETAILPTPVVAILGVIQDVTRRTPSGFAAA